MGRVPRMSSVPREEILEKSDRITKHLYLLLVYNINEFGVVPHQSRIAAAKKRRVRIKFFEKTNYLFKEKPYLCTTF